MILSASLEKPFPMLSPRCLPMTLRAPAIEIHVTVRVRTARREDQKCYVTRTEEGKWQKRSREARRNFLLCYKKETDKVSIVGCPSGGDSF